MYPRNQTVASGHCAHVRFTSVRTRAAGVTAKACQAAHHQIPAELAPFDCALEKWRKGALQALHRLEIRARPDPTAAGGRVRPDLTSDSRQQ